MPRQQIKFGVCDAPGCTQLVRWHLAIETALDEYPWWKGIDRYLCFDHMADHVAEVVHLVQESPDYCQ